MKLWKIFKSRKFALFGIIGPSIAMIAIAVSISLSPWFSFTDNALSDLGVHSVGPIFNWGLIICGVLCAGFCMHLFYFLGGGLVRNIGIFTLLLASLALIGIGVFTEDYSPHHYYFSVAFFVLLLVACVVLGISLLRSTEFKREGAVALLVALIGIVGWAIPWGDGIAIPELMSAVPAFILFIVLSLRSYRSPLKDGLSQGTSTQLSLGGK